MIRIEGLKKAYGQKTLLAEATYHFPVKERIALVGPNGAGKTTLLNMLCSIEEPDAGEIIKPSHVKIGYLPQEPNPKPAATVRQECLEGAKVAASLERQMAGALAALQEQGDSTNKGQ